MTLLYLNKFSKNLFQFGFTQGSSTTSCSFILQEIITYYNERNTGLFCVTLDASKAFDRVRFDKLFLKLIDRNLCPVILRLLLYMYTHQSLNVKWNNSHSQNFKVSNGVKQGAVLSPTLFNLYINNLLDKLESSKIGCHIGNIYCGAIAYADDIVLLCPSLYGVKHLLKICENYADDHGLLFNAQKSEFMYVTRKPVNNEFELYISNNRISSVDSIKHLGHRFDKDIPGLLNINYIVHQLNKSVNILMADFGSASSNVLLKLFVQYCTSLYGITLCDITAKSF